MNIPPYVGIPYKSHGRTKEGADCWGLVRIFYNDELGVVLPDLGNNYSNSEDRKTTAATALEEIKHWQKVEAAEPGDVILFEIWGFPMHCGIALGGNDFLHCHRGSNSCLERLDSINWKGRVAGVYRWQTT